MIFIENESRRYITQAIEIEKELTSFEVRAKCRGKILLDSEEYNKMRYKIVDLISQINKVIYILKYILRSQIVKEKEETI